MKHILIVEDDPFIVDIYIKNFAKESFSVDIAGDGQIALEKIRNNYPDVVILDIDVPKINGGEILKIIRSDPKTKNTKVIVLSNYTDQDITEKYDIDINSFDIVKRFLKAETSTEEIKNTIKEILK